MKGSEGRNEVKEGREIAKEVKEERK